MRLTHSRNVRLVALAVGLVALVALLVACAGDEKTSRATGVLPTSAEAAVQVSAPGDSGGVQQQDEPVAAVVNEQPITMAAFERERERRMMGMPLEPATLDAFDASVLDTMIDQVLIEQAALELEIDIPDDEVDAELALQSDLAAANGTSLEEVVAAQLYTMDEYRAVVRGFLLVQRVSEQVAVVPEIAPQVHSRHILVTDEATARELLNQLQAGADFAQLAAQYSLDVSTASSGGDLGWVTRGVLLQREVEDAIFALQPGQLAPDPVRSSLGYHVIQTLERVEDRPLSQASLALLQQQAFLDWLDLQRQTADIERFVGVVE